MSSTLELLLRLTAGLVLIGANAFFVAVEFALTRLRGLGLSQEEIEGEGLGRAWELTERLEIHLTGCQLGISSTSVLLGVVAEPAITSIIEPMVALVGIEGGSVRAVSVIVAVILLNLAHKIWGEQAPTYLGVERPKEVARHLAPILQWWSRIMSPIIRMGDGLAKATLSLFGVKITRSWLEEEEGVGAGAEPGEATDRGGRRQLVERMADLLAGESIPPDRRSEVLQTLRIDDIPARDIMVPSEEVIWLHLDDPVETHLQRIGEFGRVRYPVLKVGTDAHAPHTEEIAGILYVPALFEAGGWPDRERFRLERAMSPPFYVPADTVVSDLIDHLQHAHQELAILTQPDDRTRVVGIVTISDAFEVIAGDLQDPLDDEG